MATDLLSNKSADNFRILKSRTILTPNAGTYNLLNIPRRAFITDVWLFVAVVGDSDTVTIGWTGNGDTAVTNGFITTDIANIQFTGMKKATADTLTSGGSKYFDTSGGQITMTVGTTQNTGRFYVFVRHTIIY